MKKIMYFMLTVVILISLAGCGGNGSPFDSSKAISVVSREDGSGTRGAFIELFGVEVKGDDGNKKDMTTKEAVIANSTSVIITTDALGTQTEIAKKIRQKRADYVLALKGNHPNLLEDVKLYFNDGELLSRCAHKKTTEKARGGIEKREYWQTDYTAWLSGKKDWAGLTSIAMTCNTITKGEKVTAETRYFISSLPVDINEMARAICGHWMVESHHWHLDVTFREDDNHTLEKQAAFNQNILRKLALNVLKIFDTGKRNMSLKLKRFKIGINPERHLETILSL